MAKEHPEELQEEIETIAELEAKIERLESTVESDIQDVRERVVQVKRETDAKASQDHSHESLEAELTELEGDVEDIHETLDQTNSRMEGGFNNFEEILESLLDRTVALETDVDKLGQVLRSVRNTLDAVAQRDQRRARADHLKQNAATTGVRTAKCEACRSRIDVALLSAATCPSCGESFHTLDANPGFFGTSILETGDRPALEGGEFQGRPDLDSVGPESQDETQATKADFDWQNTDKVDGDSS
ncbi:hypothetical protein [Halodesulfurarchaeum sp.]|uniref:hypothetical protein n=1 Tax=Halodesulfurarchaeum sp. TaxID=1980530 RepID=UPI002FC30799